MPDYENLGFQVNVDSNESISRLDEIIKRLERIQQLEGKSIGNGSTSGKGGLSSKQKLTDEERWDKQYQDKMRKQAYYLKQGYVQQRNIISDHTKWVLAEEKKLEKKRFLTEQGYITPKTPKVSLTDEEKYTQRVERSTQLLNSAKYEEVRRTELANQQRKKEIDQRLKQELGIKQTTKSLTSYLAKLTSVVVIARKFAHFISGAINESAKYIENLNLFAVAFGDTYRESIKWALDMADAYGLASNEVLRFAGTFRELSTSLGLVGDTADLVTKTVTNLGYDLSALFNTTVEQAMEKLQSGIFSGNVRPLRAYGIDISQNQIEALFETNEALKQLGVNARNLNQSDKVLARLIITLQSGKDSFGTMAREINNLQSQFRIFQGSLANFKLAIGDLLEKPLSRVMVLLNAVIIAMTNVIRTFVPLQTKDETPKAIINTAMGAEEANEQLDELNSKLATFDKFNVLQQGEQENSALSVNEALNKVLQEQASLYDQELSDALKNMENEAVELAKKLEDVVVIAGTLLTIFAISKFMAIKNSIKAISEGFALLTGSTTKLNKGLSLTNILLITGLVYTIYKTVKAFKDGDTAAGILGITIGVVLVGAWALLNKEILITTTTKIVDFFKKLNNVLWKETKPAFINAANAVTRMQVAVAGLSIAFAAGGLAILLSSEQSAGKKLTHIFIGVAAAITAAAIAIAAFKQNWAQAIAIAGTVAGGYWTVSSLSAHKDGGYTNANLIMTHENGKREWVGKAAGSSAIVNDTQMSDIMEGAVAKGVYNALSARSAMGGNVPTNETIVVKIGEEAVFNAVRKTARRQGKDFATV